MSDGETHVQIDSALVTRLIARQFPHWSHHAVTAVVPGGWDNRTFRLGDRMSVRLPSQAGYTAQVEKEHRWLPYLAPRLPLPIPTPIAKGAPSHDYPWPWSVYGWLEGSPAKLEDVGDIDGFARALAGFLRALHRVDAQAGPPPGAHNFFRGGPLATYDQETRDAIVALDGRVDAVAATAVWEAALASTWEEAAVWVHGDVAPGNLLLRDGQLAAVIDFGCCGVGDPACDLTMAWTFFLGAGRDAFREAIALDEATWARARGWALWKVLIQLRWDQGSPDKMLEAGRVLDEVLSDRRSGR